MSLQKLMQAASLTADSVEAVDPERIHALLADYSFVAVRGLIEPAQIEAAKQRIADSLSVDNDNPPTGETPEQLRDNFQKFMVGGGELRNRDFPKCLRTFYNPLWAEDVFGMREPFRTAARLRNLAMGFDLDFAVDTVERGFWTAARIHQYPAGGGFMTKHVEDYIPTLYEAYGVKVYFQPLIVMSRKGEGADCDYQVGGGFFEHEGTRYYFEEACELGDIVIYNTSIPHGVAEVDPSKPFRQASTAGRYAGFVTMYRDLTQSS